MEKLAEDIWVAEGEIVDFNGFPYPTRCVIVRLASGHFWSGLLPGFPEIAIGLFLPGRGSPLPILIFEPTARDNRLWANYQGF